MEQTPPRLDSRQFFVYSMPAIKGVCILGVILIHVANPYSTESDWLRQLLVAVNCSARFAVPAFVILSGFYLSLNRRNESAIPFYRRTLKFLIVPYVIYSLGYSLVYFRAKLSLWLLVTNLLTASASAHLWFGLLIIQLYLLHPFLSRWYRMHRRREMCVVFAFLLQIVWSVSRWILFYDPDPFRTDTSAAERLTALLFVSNIGYFVSGYYLLDRSFEAAQMLRNGKSVYLGALAWAVTGTLLTLYWSAGHSPDTSFATSLRSHVAMNLLVPLLSCAVLVTLFPLVQTLDPATNRVHRLLHSFGLYSYGIYYFHELALYLVSVMFRHGLHLERGSPLFSLPMFLLSASVALVCVRFLARLPYGKYIT